MATATHTPVVRLRPKLVATVDPATVLWLDGLASTTGRHRGQILDALAQAGTRVAFPAVEVTAGSDLRQRANRLTTEERQTARARAAELIGK